LKINHQILSLIQQKITGLSKSQLFLRPDISKEQQNKIDQLITRYNSWEPIEYIIEQANFYGYDFFVDARVLIPRNDTEVMIDQVIKCSFKHHIDVWSGSGAIGITIAKERKWIASTFIDLHTSALKVTKINAKQHDIKASIIQSDLLSKINKIKPYTLITANLPYIKDNDYNNVDIETQTFEPATALYGWPKTGFELYEKLIDQIIEKKQNNKVLLFIEIWFDQSSYSRKYLSSKNLDFEIFKDNGGVERCIRITF
jgi:release factor glutamine methyltransferase